MLKYALLGFLNYAPMTGYELEGWINVSTGNFWQAKLSQIYTTLKKLEEDGDVVSHVEPQEGRPDRRVYTLTDQGRADLLEWVAQPIVKDTSQKKDELLLKLFFARPAGKDAILTLLRVQRNLRRQTLERYASEAPNAITQMVAENPQLSRDAILWEATRRFGVLYEEMYLRWIDETLVLIESEMDK